MRRKKESWLVTLYNDNKLYIWVVISVLVISGISIGMAMGQNKIKEVKITDDEEKYSMSNVEQTNVSPIKEEKNEKMNNDDTDNNSKEKYKSNENIENNYIDNTEFIDENEVEEKKQLNFIIPVEGEVFKDFSDNTLVYSNTLEEWINHTGIDIEAEKATPIKAIEDGIVTDIKQDPRYGYTVIIDHGQGFVSIYCNLSTLDMVYINKSVEKGQVISGIGDTALFESKDKPHLHFELMKDEIYVNPLDYIK